MATRRRFRFGTGSYRARSRDDYLTLARKLEDLGYAILLTPDHFEPQLAPLTALMAAAEASSTLRIGSYVFANDFRHPAVLAKEAATLDLLSGGRFELGIGTGGDGTEEDEGGLGFDPP